MGNKIADAALMLKMLRDAGYKNTSYAVAELVDNSIEANAKNIGVYLFEQNIIRLRTVKLVDEIAIYDDGDGMSPEVLGRCLSFGWGTRLEGATGLGKFGFGLKGASISQARRVEIYSWKNSSEIFHTYLDYDEICNNGSDELPEPTKTSIPQKYSQLITQENGELSNTGTIVIWKNLDKLTPKTSATLIGHMNKDMCRIFRHFLDDNDIYGTHRDIRVKVIDPKGDTEKNEILRANDPLYLLKPNNLHAHEDEATNEKNAEEKLEVIDPDGVTRIVHVISSVAKPEIQSIGGQSIVGRHYSNNNGISFVRAGRELELDIKGFFANSEPRHRWHGIEVRFDPQLDEYFGVPNNKQGVRNFKNFDSSEINALELDIENSEGAEKHSALMKLNLHKIIYRFIKANESVVKSRGASQNNTISGTKTTAKKVSKKIEQIEDNEDTKSFQRAQTKTNEQKLEELVQLKIKTDATISLEEATRQARTELDNLLHIEESEWPGSTFLDIQYKGNAAVALINRKHPFFNTFYDVLRRNSDQKGFEALKIFLMAFVRTEDLLQQKLGDDEFELIRDKWGAYMKMLAELSD
jgi:hypothetical protein